jgi:hypothetical protein
MLRECKEHQEPPRTHSPAPPADTSSRRRFNSLLSSLSLLPFTRSPSHHLVLLRMDKPPKETVLRIAGVFFSFFSTPFPLTSRPPFPTSSELLSSDEDVKGGQAGLSKLARLSKSYHRLVTPVLYGHPQLLSVEQAMQWGGVYSRWTNPWSLTGLAKGTKTVVKPTSVCLEFLCCPTFSPKLTFPPRVAHLRVPRDRLDLPRRAFPALLQHQSLQQPHLPHYPVLLGGFPPSSSSRSLPTPPPYDPSPSCFAR